MYSALLSLIVSVSKPGLLIPERDVESLCAISSCVNPSPCSGTADPPELVFDRQRFIQRSSELPLQLAYIVEYPHGRAYIYVQTAILQPGASAHCQHPGCEAVLNAGEAQCQLVLGPDIG